MFGMALLVNKILIISGIGFAIVIPRKF